MLAIWICLRDHKIISPLSEKVNIVYLIRKEKAIVC